jgi:hypothetical protein
MTTKTITTKTGKTITVEMVREVQDKVNFADGYNIIVGREIVEYTNITLRDATGKTLMTGNEIDTPKSIPAEMKAKGAVACIGNAYVTQEIVDLTATALAELEAENPKSDEQIAIETAKTQAIADHDAWYDSPDAVRARKLERDMDDPNSDL